MNINLRKSSSNNYIVVEMVNQYYSYYIMYQGFVYSCSTL